MDAQDIITKFELFVDDMTELSTQEELDLLNKIYQRVCMYKPWEFLKKTASGTLSTTVPYVTLPDDFSFLLENNKWSDTNIGVPNTTPAKVVFIGTNFTPYEIVNWSDRRQYRTNKNVAYLDLPNNRLVFPVQPTSADTYEFDYMSVPEPLIITDTPIIPARFVDILYHGMCAEDYIIQQSDKARSYQKENEAKYTDYLSQMNYWNANLIQM